MKKAILILTTLIIIQGCTTKPLTTDKIITLETLKCDPIPEFNGKTMGDLYESYIELAKLYKQCSDKK